MHRLRTTWVNTPKYKNSFRLARSIKNLIKECNFEIVSLSITRTYCNKLYINSMIRFVSYDNTTVNKYCICKDQTPFFFSANRQPIISFIIIKNLIAVDKKNLFCKRSKRVGSYMRVFTSCLITCPL